MVFAASPWARGGLLNRGGSKGCDHHGFSGKSLAGYCNQSSDVTSDTVLKRDKYIFERDIPPRFFGNGTGGRGWCEAKERS